MSQATKLKEYSERHRFWTDQAVKQTTFSNNILLTISIAVFGYFFVNRGVVYKVLVLDFALPINPPVVFFIVGTLFITISMMLGFLLSFTRLYDFRLTRHILLTRKRAMKECYILPDNELPEESFCQLFMGFLSIIFKFDKYRIRKRLGSRILIFLAAFGPLSTFIRLRNSEQSLIICVVGLILLEV